LSGEFNFGSQGKSKVVAMLNQAQRHENIPCA